VTHFSSATRRTFQPPFTLYFYDLTEKRLFAAPRGSIPPIAGIKGEADAGVRAVVICTNGNPNDKKHLSIAYLQKYAPEIKQLFEEVHKAREEGRDEQGRINRNQIPPNTLVRRLEDNDWHVLNSPEGQEIANGWNKPGPDGQTPVICSP
jgi:hypothetical protein